MQSVSREQFINAAKKVSLFSKLHIIGLSSFCLHVAIPLLASSSSLPIASIDQASTAAPVLFLMFGPNGAGKTTSSAKLAHMYIFT
jgi:hypothetical protein